MTDNSRKNQKKPSLGGLVVLLLIIFANVISEASPRDRAALVPILVIAVIVAAVIAVVAKAAKRATAASAGRAAPARSGRVQPARQIRAHASRETFPSPDAYCLVCDQTNTDHFERDRQRRLRQLDYWLSIGLIDRKEYRTLQEKYSKSVPHSGV